MNLRIHVILLACIAALGLPLAAQGGPGGGGPGGGGPGGGGPGPGPQLPPVPVPLANPLTPAKAVLGKILFWDEQLSSSGTVACGTCHRADAGGGDLRVAVNPGFDGVFGNADDVFSSPGLVRSDLNNDYLADPEFGLDVQVTRRTSPTMIMAAYAPSMFWDGRAGPVFTDPTTNVVVINGGGALESQAIAPPLAEAEMAHDLRGWPEVLAKLGQATPLRLATNWPADVAAAIAANPTYPDLFTAAFGDAQITVTRIAFAIASYERTLIANQTPFDAFLAGTPGALTMNQMMGRQVFVTNGQCNVCHTGPLTTDHSFRNLGLRPLAEDQGRFEVTGNAADRGRFKVPTLRNAALRPRFMHNGQFQTLQQVVAFYAGGGGTFPANKDPVLANIVMTPNEQQAVVDFVQNALVDPRVAAEQFPFDRPTLASESGLGAWTSIGFGVAGSGGFTPRMMVDSPPALGNSDFRIGLRDALGSASAFLLFSSAQAAVGLDLGGMPIYTDPYAAGFGFWTYLLNGSGAGAGYTTARVPIPNQPWLLGANFVLQWLVYDPAAPTSFGYVGSEGRKITLF